jgi:hypothetical protein
VVAGSRSHLGIGRLGSVAALEPRGGADQPDIIVQLANQLHADRHVLRARQQWQRDGGSTEQCPERRYDRVAGARLAFRGDAQP